MNEALRLGFIVKIRFRLDAVLFSFLITYCNHSAPKYQGEFLICENLHGNKAVSDL